jgi:flavodoxin
MLVIHNHKKGNNQTVANIIAEHFNCSVESADSTPSIKEFETIIFVVPNTGDEELPEQMEKYLIQMNEKNKKYIVCELGNYFGFENYCGCKKVVFKILDALGWKRISDVSIDSLPFLDTNALQTWLDQLAFEE